MGEYPHTPTNPDLSGLEFPRLGLGDHAQTPCPDAESRVSGQVIRSQLACHSESRFIPMLGIYRDEESGVVG